MLSSRLGKSGFGLRLAGGRPLEMPWSPVVEFLVEALILVDALMVVIVHPLGDPGLQLDQIPIAARVN